MAVATAEQLASAEANRAAADAAAKRVEESWDRSDTDGFLTQWASGLTSRKHTAQAKIDENGGTARFVGLFDADGNRIAAKQMRGEYGAYWALVDENDTFTGVFINRTKAAVGTRPSARSKMGQYGLYEDWEEAPARAVIQGSGTGLSGNAWVATVRTDKGYPAGARVVE